MKLEICEKYINYLLLLINGPLTSFKVILEGYIFFDIFVIEIRFFIMFGFSFIYAGFFVDGKIVCSKQTKIAQNFFIKA